MFGGFDEWRGTAAKAMADYAQLRQHIEELETESARLLARAIDAYQWPSDIPEPSRVDGFKAEHIGDHAFGEDLTGELAIANHTSMAAARYLVTDLTTLIDNLPQCWDKVASGEAPFRQARRVAQETAGFVPSEVWPQVDDMIAPSLGAVNSTRLGKVIDAAITRVNPEWVRLKAQDHPRHVYTGADKRDPLTGWVSARLDGRDALSLESTVQLISDKLAADGDTTTLDVRRAKALGLLANPAAAIQLVGRPSATGLSPASVHEIEAAFTPRTQVYVHLHLDNLGNDEAAARVEKIGPLLVEQIADITKGSRVRLTPVVHAGASGAAVDSYEIPRRIREQVLMRDPYDVFPWSSTPSRHLDLDHTTPYESGKPAQTRPDNLGPLSRKAHRIKTHAGWSLDQPRPGVFIWASAAGQQVQVDHTGSHPIRPDP